MWVEAGQDEARFWDQTPALFQAVMSGAERRERRQFELMTFAAWQGERFARTGKLKPLDHYLSEMRRKNAQTPAEMLKVLKALGTGTGMEITRFEDGRQLSLAHP